MKELFYIYDDQQLPIWEVSVEQDEKYKEIVVKFIVRLIGGWEEDENGEYMKPAVDCIEDYMEMSVKWDGCSHLRFGEIDEDGSRDAYLHFCGADSFKKHVRLLHMLYTKAYEYMGREPYDKSEVWDDL